MVNVTTGHEHPLRALFNVITAHCAAWWFQSRWISLFTMFLLNCYDGQFIHGFLTSLLWFLSLLGLLFTHPSDHLEKVIRGEILIEVAHEVIRVEFTVLGLHAHEITTVKYIHKIAKYVIHQIFDLLSHPLVTLLLTILGSIVSWIISRFAPGYSEKASVFILIWSFCILWLLLRRVFSIYVNKLRWGHRNPSNIDSVLLLVSIDIWRSALLSIVWSWICVWISCHRVLAWYVNIDDLDNIAISTSKSGRAASEPLGPRRSVCVLLLLLISSEVCIATCCKWATILAKNSGHSAKYISQGIPAAVYIFGLGSVIPGFSLFGILSILVCIDIGISAKTCFKITSICAGQIPADISQIDGICPIWCKIWSSLWLLLLLCILLSKWISLAEKVLQKWTVLGIFCSLLVVGSLIENVVEKAEVSPRLPILIIRIWVGSLRSLWRLTIDIAIWTFLLLDSTVRPKESVSTLSHVVSSGLLVSGLLGLHLGCRCGSGLCSYALEGILSLRCCLLSLLLLLCLAGIVALSWVNYPILQSNISHRVFLVSIECLSLPEGHMSRLKSWQLSYSLLPIVQVVIALLIVLSISHCSSSCAIVGMIAATDGG